MASSKKEYRDWYSISIDTLRGWLAVVVLVGLGLVGYQLYRQHERGLLDLQAAEWISEAMELRGRLESLGVPAEFRADYLAARSQLEEAQGLRAAGSIEPAAKRARQSRDLFAGVLDALGAGGPGSQARFLSVSGSVEYRRGGDGPWESARTRVALRSGDYVKTTDGGTAQVVFGDGTLYTVRPNTLFVVTRSVGADGAAVGGEQAIRMEYGWVNLNTSQRPSEIQTPSARARVREASEASVAYDQGNARFAALRGSIELSSGGAQREVKELQEVVQEGSRLSTPRPLPGAPTLSEPAENQQFTLDSKQPMVLGWEAATNAARYALQISRTREFLDTVLDVENRTTTRATLGLRGEGIFSWRVAAISREGAQGPWSTPRQFRVVRAERPGDVDKTPPQLELENVKLYGNLVILAGRTEPGAVLRVNGETVAIDAEGAFTKTVQFTREGWNFVEVRSTDAWGNEAARRRRVFVEADL